METGYFLYNDKIKRITNVMENSYFLEAKKHWDFCPQSVINGSRVYICSGGNISQRVLVNKNTLYLLTALIKTDKDTKASLLITNKDDELGKTTIKNFDDFSVVQMVFNTKENSSIEFAFINAGGGMVFVENFILEEIKKINLN